MQKTLKRTITVILLLCVALAFACFAACGGNTPDIPDTPPQQGQTGTGENNGEQSGTEVVLSGTDIKTQNLTVDGTNLSYTVSNATTTYSMINEITVADGASWKLYPDIECTTEVVSKTVSLNEGDNLVYVLVTNGTDIKLYTATLRRRHMYTVTFNTDEGLEVEKQNVEEGFCATEPNVKKIDGYSLTGKWDLDFSVPIQKDTIVMGAYTVDVKLSEDGTTVIGLNNSVSNLVILSEYNGITVTSIADRAFSGCSTLTGVTIPNSVTSIGMGAFRDCSSLESVTIPFVGAKAGITSDDKYQYPFGYIFGTTSYVGGTATKQYYYGSSTSSKTNDIYYIPSSLKKVTITGGDILYGAFYNCNSLTNITIPNNETSIKGSVFNGCKSLTSIIIPSGVTSIGTYAFACCDLLTSVIIPDSVTSIGYGAFYHCDLLSSITIGNGVTSIGDNAFEHCFQLVEVINKSDLEITKGNYSKNGGIGYYALNIKTEGTSDIENKDGYLFYTYDKVNYLLGYIGNETSLMLPDNYNGQNYVINKYSFCGCSLLTSINIPNSVTSIGYNAFGGCGSLVSITIDGVTNIEDAAFYNCDLMKNIYIEDINDWVQIEGLDVLMSNGKNLYVNRELITEANITTTTKINDYAFKGCSSLRSITIGNSVASIGSSAFYNCSSLTSVTIGSGVMSIGSKAFDGCSLIENICYNGDINDWVQIEGISNLMGYGKSSKNLYINGELLTEANITTATKINDYAFRGCIKLTSITIPNSVTSIGDSAFSGCKLSQYYEYDNAYYLGNENNKYIVLMKAKSTNIVNCNINENCKFIYQSAFTWCGSLTSVTIPNSVTSIGSSAFSDCSSLTSVTIPNSVTSIGYYAINGVWDF